MRQSEFRGKTEEGEWIYGDFQREPFEHDDDMWSEIGFIYESKKEYSERKEVSIKTVEEYAGMWDDAHVNKVYEGDIIFVDTPDKVHQLQTVVFKDGCFCGYSDKKTCKWTTLDVLKRAHGFKIVGNTHEE